MARQQTHNPMMAITVQAQVPGTRGKLRRATYSKMRPLLFSTTCRRGIRWYYTLGHVSSSQHVGCVSLAPYPPTLLVMSIHRKIGCVSGTVLPQDIQSDCVWRAPRFSGDPLFKTGTHCVPFWLLQQESGTREATSTACVDSSALVYYLNNLFWPLLLTVQLNSCRAAPP